ncbi:hypothetical protein FORC36_1468 [Vibrio vulnificus]|nr:hypothetical protein FORC36_1468 [Vibrio vulnificus]
MQTAITEQSVDAFDGMFHRGIGVDGAPNFGEGEIGAIEHRFGGKHQRSQSFL